ncbi:surface-associated interspersed protein (SURFIN) [Plasmodium gallinaceum]|uniref:Surface-associated interspersed protein (SURFIN) n=1 Tax=Plasmodium gallinaceum TaxID=5849 RepID=A0A1J1GZU0_PLAGA|nr:surface-associated interspersed protein (SURFIN) [Plasmodium gallinaceum]CRG97970.1 surface-associated interspersed protein (SURFIN) [Plasmodium gallinaceum]
MRKKSIIKKARFLSEAEETSCILDEQNGKTEENEDISSERSKLNTEIRTFDEDTNNELNFYLDDNNITNDTEKCKKASSYINWRGMDYVNLLLNKKEDYNISCLVEKWKEKQNSFQTSIVQKTNSACNEKTFNYCAILNKNNGCSRPYENNDLPVSTLTYNQLNETSYSDNKTQIIEQRQLKFDNVTNDISYYYYRRYEDDKSELNCGKWSMYIYKRGMQFVNMFASEFYDDPLYINNSIQIWNDYSNTMEKTVLEQTGNKCNMTTLIYQIKERKNTDDPYNLDWLSSNSTQNISNETLNNATALPDTLQDTLRDTLPDTLQDTLRDTLPDTLPDTLRDTLPDTLPDTLRDTFPDNLPDTLRDTLADTLPDSLQPTTVTPNVLHNDTTTGSLGNNTTSVNDVDGTSPSEYTLTKDTSVPPVAVDQIVPGTATAISPEDSTQSNSLTPKDTIHSSTNTISGTTSSSHSPEVLTSPTTETLPSNSTTSSGTPSVTPLPGEISPTATNEYSNTTMKTFTNNITASTTSTKSPATSLPSENVTFVNKNISTIGNTSVTNVTASPSIDPISSPEIAPSLTTMTTTPTDSSTPPLPSSIPKITTLPSTNNSTSRTNDMPIHPTNDVTHKTATSPFLTNTTENSTATIEPFTNKIASPETDIISPAINTTSLMSDTISPTPLSNSLDKTPILTTTTAFFPTTNNNLPSNQTDIIQLQNQQNIHVPLKQVQQHVNGRNSTENISLSTTVTVPNISTPIPPSDPTEVTPTVTPKGNLLIPMVPVGIFILGIIFLLVLICKCTPIGSWIRNRKSKKKKARKKIKKITREPLLMDTNNIKNEPINNENYSFLYQEKEIPLYDMILENEKDLKYKHLKKSKAHKGM